MDDTTKKRAALAVRDARINITLRDPFFGALVNRLEWVPSQRGAPFWTDGRRVGYDPDRIAGWTQEKVEGACVHEVLHCALGHPWRRGARDPKLWNVAADYVVHAQMRRVGYYVAPDWLQDDRFDDLSTEAVYRVLFDEQQQQQGDDGGGGEKSTDDGAQSPPTGGGGAQPPEDGADDDPAGTAQGGAQPPDGGGEGESHVDGASGGAGGDPDGPVPPPDGGAQAPDTGGGGGAGEKPEAHREQIPDTFDGCGPGAFCDGAADDSADATEGDLEAEWAAAVVRAEWAAKARGDGAGRSASIVEEAQRQRADLPAELRRFFAAASRDDYSWRFPATRYLSTGLYMPALRDERMGTVVIVRDTSGSIGGRELAQFNAEIRSVLDECRPRRVVVMDCDARIGRVVDIDDGDPMPDALKHAVGGGGTSFCEPFEWVERELVDELPAALVYLTDLCGSFPQRPPTYPVLWVSTLRDVGAPFGEVVEIDAQ